ncbi:MAG TPA: OmpA family protein [Phycisphaerae bacterium]|nr:OmpA family protein [Phycisphaerae bacterium]
MISPLHRLPRPSHRILAMLIVGLFLAASTGCVSMDEHKRLQTAFDQSRAQLAEAENDLNAARARNAELEARVAELNRLVGLGGNDALRRERDLLAQQLADLQKKYNDLLALNANTPALPEDINNALRQLADKYPDLLEFDERLGMVRFKSDLTFDLGSTEVKPRAKEALAQFATILNMPEIAQQEITVVGHTDDVPIRLSKTMQMNPSNWILSTNRAWAVSSVLRSDGVAENRVSAAGWGDQRPIAPNAPGHHGNEKNRRVDIYIRPTKVPEGITVSTPGAPAASPRTTHPTHKPALKPAAAPTTAPAPADTTPIPAG